MRIGIPRALLYYQYFPMWRAFFQHLGGEVVVSDPTSRAVVVNGATRLVSDTCLPVKVYCGHVTSLVGKCDYVFIPGIRSLEKGAYNCSKFLGLPDMVRAAVPACPPIIQVDIDTNLGKGALYQAVYKIGRHLTWKPWKVKEAADVAWQAHLSYQGLMQREGLTPPEAIEEVLSPSPRPERIGPDTTRGLDHAVPSFPVILAPSFVIPAKAGIQAGGYNLPRNPSVGTDLPDATGLDSGSRAGKTLVIALIGHPYALYDSYINHRLIERLRGLGAQVVTPEMVPHEGLQAGVERLVSRPYWTYEDEVVGAGGYYLESRVDGVISVVPFGCGPDSLMLDVVRRSAQRQRGPAFMSLTIDEHTGEAGLVTRLEAFLDMLQRRRRRPQGNL